MDGISVDRIVGFEGLGYNQNSFTAQDLEARLLSAGVLARSKIQATEGSVHAQRGSSHTADDNDDDEWD